jgi:hypothetical protein
MKAAYGFMRGVVKWSARQRRNTAAVKAAAHLFSGLGERLDQRAFVSHER